MSFAIIPDRTLIVWSMFSAVVYRESENRIEPRAVVYGMFIARNTGDASCESELHAEPVETHMPASSNIRTIFSPSIYSNEMFVVFGRRFARVRRLDPERRCWPRLQCPPGDRFPDRRR